MVTALLQRVRFGVRRSSVLHSLLDSTRILAAGNWLYRRLLLRRGYMDTALMGQRLRIAISSEREITRVETFNEQAFVQQMLDSIRPGDVIWDVGANIGLISLLLASRAAELGATIHAFEPEPRNFNELVRNIELNGFGKVIAPHNVALSDLEGETTLFVSGEAGEGRHSMLAPLGGPAAPLAIRVESAVSFAARNRHYPTVVKIDVEGAEMRVLRGMHLELGFGALRDIFVELHPERLLVEGTSEREIELALKRFAYSSRRTIVRATELQRHYCRSGTN